MSKKSKNPVSLLISELEEMSGGKVLFTERLEDPLPSSPTMDWLLSKEHILFSRPVGTLAFQVQRQLQLDNAGEFIVFQNTATGDETWDIMFSLMSKIKKDLKKMNWSASLGRLVGILIYANGDETWIADNEVWDDKKKFTKWFTDYSQAWKEVLKRSDEELGLALQGGREGGYRSTLVKMIRGWQNNTNQLLDDLYNGKDNHNFSVKVDIVGNDEKEKESESSEKDPDAPSKASKRKVDEDDKEKPKTKKSKSVKAKTQKKKHHSGSDQASSGSK